MAKKNHNKRAPVVAVINSNDDLVAALANELKQEGYTPVTAHVADIKSGSEDFIAFLQRHEPDLIIYDIAVPYEDNWTFLGMLRTLPQCQHIPFVITTVNKRVLDSRVGPTDALEIVGGHADDVEPTLEAVRKGLHAGSGTRIR
jgi:CheY-like chemotaxis protein